MELSRKDLELMLEAISLACWELHTLIAMSPDVTNCAEDITAYAEKREELRKLKLHIESILKARKTV